jgi:hypothetical protein
MGAVVGSIGFIPEMFFDGLDGREGDEGKSGKADGRISVGSDAEALTFVGHPQFGQDSALSLNSRPHSAHLMRAMPPSFT